MYKRQIQALRDGVVLVGGRDDLDFAALLASEPNPSGAELLDAGVVELGLEIFEVAERLGDGLGLSLIHI